MSATSGELPALDAANLTSLNAGELNTASGGVAIGTGANVDAVGTIAIGVGANASATNTVTIGNASGTNYNLQVTGSASIDGALGVTDGADFLGDIVMNGNAVIRGNVATIDTSVPAVGSVLPAYIIMFDMNVATISNWFAAGVSSGTICKVINDTGGLITHNQGGNIVIPGLGPNFVQAAGQVISMIYVVGPDQWYIEE